MIVTLIRFFHYVFKNLDPDFIFILTVTVFLLFRVLFLRILFILDAAALEPHSARYAEFVIEGHLWCYVALTSLSTLTSLSLDLWFLIILKETVIINFIQFYLG